VVGPLTTASHLPGRDDDVSDDSGPQPGVGDIGARETAAEDVDRFHLCPVDGGDVAEVRDAGEPHGEHLRGVGVGLDVPGDGAADDRLDSEVERADPGEQRPDPHAAAFLR
jgi:hypothetical protein